MLQLEIPEINQGLTGENSWTFMNNQWKNNGNPHEIRQKINSDIHLMNDCPLPPCHVSGPNRGGSAVRTSWPSYGMAGVLGPFHDAAAQGGDEVSSHLLLVIIIGGDGLQGGAPPVMWTVVYNPHEYYRYNPLINPSEIVLINQLS